MFTRFAHVCLGVRDLEQSIAYYRKLGFEEVFRFTRKGRQFGVYLKVSDRQFIEIFEDPEMGPVVNNGILHFCLETEDLDSLMATLTERGVAFTTKKMGVDESWQIWLEDPTGNRFEVHEYTPTSAQFSPRTVEADW